MTNEVWEPCLRAAVRAHGHVPGMSNVDVMERMRSMSRRDWARMYTVWEPTLAGKSRSERVELYKIGRARCILATLTATGEAATSSNSR